MADAATILIIDDDPDLVMWFETSTGNLDFALPELGENELFPFLPAINLSPGELISLGNGFNRFTFRDQAPVGSDSKKFVRAVLSLQE